MMFPGNTVTLTPMANAFRSVFTKMASATSKVTPPTELAASTLNRQRMSSSMWFDGGTSTPTREPLPSKRRQHNTGTRDDSHHSKATPT